MGVEETVECYCNEHQVVHQISFSNNNYYIIISVTNNKVKLKLLFSS
jgi:hypothetical protein